MTSVFPMILIIVGTIVLGILLAIRQAQKQSDAWEAFAENHALDFVPGTWFIPSSIMGTYRGVVIAIKVETRGPDNARTRHTRVSGSFASALPYGLHITVEGLGDSPTRAFGGQDIFVGIDELDLSLRITGHDETDVRAFLGRRRIRKAVLRFLKGDLEREINFQRVTLVTKGIETNPVQLQTWLDEVVDTVKWIDDTIQEIRQEKLFASSYGTDRLVLMPRPATEPLLPPQPSRPAHQPPAEQAEPEPQVAEKKPEPPAEAKKTEPSAVEKETEPPVEAKKPEPPAEVKKPEPPIEETKPEPAAHEEKSEEIEPEPTAVEKVEVVEKKPEPKPEEKVEVARKKPLPPPRKKRPAPPPRKKRLEVREKEPETDAVDEEVIIEMVAEEPEEDESIAAQSGWFTFAPHGHARTGSTSTRRGAGGSDNEWPVELADLGDVSMSPSERKKRVATHKGRTYSAKVEVDRVTWTTGFKLAKNLRDGRTLIGKIRGGLEVEIRYPTDRTAEVEYLSHGDQILIRASVVEWDAFYRRLLMDHR